MVKTRDRIMVPGELDVEEGLESQRYMTELQILVTEVGRGTGPLERQPSVHRSNFLTAWSPKGTADPKI